MPSQTVALRAATIILLFLGSLLSCQTRTVPPPPPGAIIAPAFSLKNLDAKTVSLEKSRGKIVLVHFWATWCLSCVHELTTLQHLYAQLDRDEFELFAIAVDDSWEAIRAVQNTYQFSFPILFDERGDIRQAYNVSGLPQSFLLGRSGEFLSFPQPDSAELVSRTEGAQSWDRGKTVEYFKRMTSELEN